MITSHNVPTAAWFAQRPVVDKPVEAVLDSDEEVETQDLTDQEPV